jgi:16S rRNA (cytosine1402-N4)-methyltransferase
MMGRNPAVPHDRPRWKQSPKNHDEVSPCAQNAREHTAIDFMSDDAKPLESISAQGEPQPVRKRRPRYSGRNPRKFHEKYKELNADRYASEVQRILQSGKTPAGTHRPIMVAEILEVVAPKAGEIAVDATLGYGGHARAILERIQPGGKLLGLDVDPIELPRTEERLRLAGFGPEVFAARRSNFAGLPQALAREGFAAADIILADLGVSSMQLDNPERGFTFKESGPLDMRMNPSRGEPASQFLAHISEEKLARLLEENSDEPHAPIIAAALKKKPIGTTEELCRVIRETLRASYSILPKDEIETSIRRVFQALRIAVNDEFSALDSFLRNLPACLKPNGRVAILTFHSGEDRRVKKSLQASHRDGIYSAIADEVIRPSAEETRANPRASPAKLRWAMRSGT